MYQAYFFFEASIAHAIAAAMKNNVIMATIESDISSLERQAAEFGRGIDGWNKLYVWALLFALIAGTLSFLAQRQTIKSTRRLDRVKGEIAQIKDRALARELKEKDRQIATLDKARADAEKETAALKHDALIRALPRWSRITPKLGESVEKAPPGAVEIIFAPENDEAHRTALAIEAELSAVGKWKLIRRASPASRDRQELILPLFADDPFNTPLMSRIGLLTDITLVAPATDLVRGFPREGTPLRALWRGLIDCEFQLVCNFDNRLASGSVRVLVGTKE